MEQQKDIGKLIQERLKDTIEAPTGLEWNQVSASLDKRDRKRRFLLLIWTGIAISGLTVLTILFYTGYTNSEKTPLVHNDAVIPINHPEITEAIGTLDLNENEKQLDVSNNDSAIEIFDSERSLQSPSIDEANSEVEQMKNKEAQKAQTKEILIANKDWTTNKTQEDITKTFTLDSVTTYRYYNHNTENELITTDKSTIDSLVELSEKTKDSIN